MYDNVKKQYYSLDILKIVLTLLVVAIHINPFNSLDAMDYVRYPLILIAVPMFFCISSFLFFSKYDNSDNKKQLIIRFVKRNLLLYLCWFVILLPATIYIRGYFSNGFRGGLQFVIDLFIGSTFRSSWFIMALVIGTLIVAFLSKYLKNIGSIILGIMFYIICLFASGYGNLIQNNPLMWFINHYPATIYQSFPISIVFISIGKVVADYREKLMNKRTVWLIATIITFIMLVVEFWILEVNQIQIAYAYYVMTIPFCLFLLALFTGLDIKLSDRFALCVRKCSTVTYCLHTTLAWLIVALLSKINVSSDFPMSLLIYIVVVAVCVLVTLVIDKLSKFKYLSFLKYFY